MTRVALLPGACRFEKHYPSVGAADAAQQRSLAARLAGVPTPDILCRNGPLHLSFEQIAVAAPPSLADMLEVLNRLNRMPPDGLIRFDPFLRIRPRLCAAPPHIKGLAATLEAQDAALRWSGSAVIHGDFHPGQTIRDRSGKTWLLDLDDLALGPPEADLGNLAAWLATSAAGRLDDQARAAMTMVLALSPQARPDLAAHFFRIALVRRCLKLVEKGLPWALDQLPLRA
jgi:hypothetical protein